MFLRASELKNTTARVCSGYNKLINVDEGQGGNQETKKTTMTKPQPAEHPSPRLMDAALALLHPPWERSADARTEPKHLSYEARPVPNMPRRLPKLQRISERMHRIHRGLT